MTEKQLKEAALETPDAGRSLKNLSSFLAENPSLAGELSGNLREVSLLFSYSQFLANYCIANPDELLAALKSLTTSPDRESLFRSLQDDFSSAGSTGTRSDVSPPQHSSLDPYMSAVRRFRIKEILRITLRDLLRKADLVETMIELSRLADVVIKISLDLVRNSLNELYGAPAHDAFSVIALGKLGGEELNFSSDVDLIFVYGTEKGETTGTMTAQGVTAHRISNHEYYCKLGEVLTRFLAQNTDSGFAYRVDLRLRPEGQRGDIALSLRGYEMYYESWGRAWERAMLIRARPVAGEMHLANDFMEMIRPFVYRKYLDFSSIDEIKRLKIRIDSTFKKGNIKRGYGGIREIEFFAQALQLIYGGREPLLRERNLLKTLHRLLQKALIGQEDYSILSENYRFLRTLEHRLQQLNDIQTHTLPSADPDLEILSRKMGFQDRKSFMSDLERRRTKVRNIYDSLFAQHREKPVPSGTFFNEEFSDAELKDYLSGTTIRDIDRAVKNIKSIKDSTLTFQTLRGRRLLSEILPLFVDSALKSSSPDHALNHLQSFASLLSTRESYLEIFSINMELIEMLTYAFAQSEYLSKILISRPQNLELIGLQDMKKESLMVLKREIKDSISEGHSINEAIRLLKQIEELRTGLLFLQKKIPVISVIKGLSKTAEAVLAVCLDQISEDDEGLAIIGFGKLGGRELAFNADLDIIFASRHEVTQQHTKSAERLLRMLISYTKEGIAYRVDTRLRPDGSKGPLVSSLESFGKYYDKAAAFWEFQALLKARPVAGDTDTGRAFINMAKDILVVRGREISASDIRHMRDRIQKALSRESGGYDIKLGPGGIEEIEFTIQYLQLAHCRRHKSLLVQGTLDALNRLRLSGVMNKKDADSLRENYIFYRTLESFLRLRGENILKRDKDITENTAVFMGFGGNDAFIQHLNHIRERTQETTERYLVTS